MFSTALAFLISLMITAALTPVVRRWANRRNLAATPRSERDVHELPIPRLGGVAMVVGFMAPLVGLLLLDSGIGRYIERDHPEWETYVIALFGGTLAIGALGIYDDLRGANAYQKLAVQILVAVFVWKLGVRIDLLGLFGARLEVGVFSLPLTVIWIVVIINAMNLIDGLDGLASGVALMATLPNLALAIYAQNVVMMVLMAALAGCLVGFLFYNFRPASIFMGDTGSMFLGFVLATASILGNAKSTATVSMIVPVLALGLPIMDTLLAVLRRSLSGKSLFNADTDHVHHKLIKRGLSHKQAVLFLYGVSFVLACAALASAFVRGRNIALLLGALALCSVLLMRKLGYLQWLATPATRQRARELRTQVRGICSQVRETQDLTTIWRSVEPLRGLLSLAALELKVGDERFSWKSSTATATGTSRVDLYADSASVGELRVLWRGFRGSREEKMALDLVGDAIGDALSRMRAEDSHNVIPLRRRKPSQSA
jgi:UDP-GlcNAc:undecaprenyl-phosphate GlcNAc-1-phosphate transferase